MRTALFQKQTNSRSGIPNVTKLTAIVSMVMLASCFPGNGKKFAETVFEDIEVSRVLAYKKFHTSPYGCTFVVVRLAEDPPQKPPNIRLQSYSYRVNFADQGAWRPTPMEPTLDLGFRKSCLTGVESDGRPEGRGLGGHGRAIWKALQKPNAWFSIHGGSAHQIMHIYAPEERIAVRLRYGD